MRESMKFWRHPLIANIGTDQVSSLFKTTPVSMVGILASSTIMSVSLLQETPWLEVVLWWVVTTLLAAYALCNSEQD